ncbi:hypothetical protein CWATWH0003_B200 [Crocosphaera watsonii WH 0003]|uniref:Uncharacterized protein n=2 Tax=Crocosphaera watsonii TaxID=263511 RepID=G5JEL3_CROWT|nr:hypothetical protein CWATWH0003_B200 [Crocosphaera watsonii WH 0003]
MTRTPLRACVQALEIQAQDGHIYHTKTLKTSLEHLLKISYYLKMMRKSSLLIPSLLK